MEGLTTVFLFKDGRQIILENVITCTEINGSIQVTCETETCDMDFLFRREDLKMWVGVLDKSDLLFENDKCVGWKEKKYFDKERD